MSTRILTGLGVVALVLVLGLGTWGWSDHAASAARHTTALRAKNQPRFCENLGYAVSSVTGQPLFGSDVPFTVPVVPPTEADLVSQAGYMETTFRESLLPDAPPVLRKDLERVIDAFAETNHSGSAKAFTSRLVLQSLKVLADYFRVSCSHPN